MSSESQTSFAFFFAYYADFFLRLASFLPEPTLLEQLALLSNPTPADLDPELAYSSLSSSKNAQAKEDDGLGEEEDKGNRDHYLEVG